MDNAVFERGGETTRLGSFEIVRKLARGGMAEIFLAITHGPSGFEKLVVLKKILPKYAGKPRFVQLFLEEAKLAASLAHPNIAQVFDIGMVDGSYFFTMEYLHGQDVRSILHRTWRIGQKFPVEHAVQIARHVASALHFAHEKQHSDGSGLGIVHRDVSPSNIIVTYDGATKLLDFGVAKTTASTVKTRTGALKGKISYMSPEQARGAPIDRRSDIFSLGIVLWEMVTTQRLFRAENDLATLQLIIHQPPKSPISARPDCPPELERIVVRALAQDPADRYQTAEQLVIELDELAREHRLRQSSNALSTTLGELFSPELTAWRDARAAGVPLADHLHNVGDLTTPVSESDFIELDASLDDSDVEEVEELDDDEEKTEHMPAFDPLRLGEIQAEHAPAYDPRQLASDAQAQQAPAHAPRRPGSEARGEQAPAYAPRRPGSDARGEQAPAYDPLTPADDAQTRQAPQYDPRSAQRDVHSEPTVAYDARRPGSDAHAQQAPTYDPRHDAETAHMPPFDPLPAGDAHTESLETEMLATEIMLAPPGAPAPGVGPVPPGPFGGDASAPGATPSAPFPAVGTHASSGSIPVIRSNAPFAAPPWQQGQPPPVAPADRVARSWAVIDLPAYDPAMFERQRRIALRIAAGLVGVIFLLAILAGRC